MVVLLVAAVVKLGNLHKVFIVRKLNKIKLVTNAVLAETLSRAAFYIRSMPDIFDMRIPRTSPSLSPITAALLC